MMQYRKGKGLISLRTSHNAKPSNPMTKSLKLGTLVNLRKSGKGSVMTKASPTTHDRRNKTNNPGRTHKTRRLRGLLSFQSEEESLGVSQELRKKNALLRSEIIERQKKMGKLREEPIRSVSAIVGDEVKMERKKLGGNNAKKKSNKKIAVLLTRRTILKRSWRRLTRQHRMLTARETREDPMESITRLTR